MLDVSHVQGDDKGVRGVSHVQGDRGVRGVSHVQGDGKGAGASVMFKVM